MAETKWTPGEWRVDTLGIGTPWTIDTQDENIALAAQVVGDDQKQTRRRANAHLIAAAPDLYAASEAIVAACERERPDIIGRDDEYIYDELGSAMSGAYVAARAALAKARGEAK